MKLTEAAVKRLKPSKSGRVDYFDQVLPAFGLRVSAKGVKSWFVMTRVNGKLIRFTLGRFPGLELGPAREKAREALDYASIGIDPRQVKEEQRKANAAAARNTYSSVANEFLVKYVNPKLKVSTQKEYQRVLLGRDVEPWLAQPITSISKRDVLDHLDRVTERATDFAADNQLAYLRKFFNWCADRDIIEVVPTDRMRRKLPIPKRDRVLNETELRLIWNAFEKEGGLFGVLFQLILLTGQRRAEVAGMRFDEISDLDGNEPIWEIPASRTKNKLPHIVPLTPQMLRLIESRPSKNEFVFTTTGETAVSGFSRAKNRVDEHLNEIDDWRLHDLRRTMVTTMNDKLGVLPHVVEAVVNHITGPAKSGVAGVYNKALYLEERREALNRWNVYVDSLSS